MFRTFLAPHLGKRWGLKSSLMSLRTSWSRYPHFSGAKIGPGQKRALSLAPGSIKVPERFAFIVRLFSGIYIGGAIVCGGLMYLLYNDANSRQHIPFELSFDDQVTCVKAINKDDVLKSPRYAVKHYRRLLIELAKHEDSNLQFDENDPENKFRCPLIDSNTLVYKKSNSFANFYVDIVSRYAKALLAKGELNVALEMLQSLVQDDDIFFKLGDAERLSQCSRLLGRISPDWQSRVDYLKRTIAMITSTYSTIRLDNDYRLQEGSRITDELIACLNDLAFVYAKASSDTNKSINSKTREALKSKSLNIYLSNLKTLQGIKDSIESGQLNQAHFPLFNCDNNNLLLSVNEIKGHLSELMWAKGYKQNALSWGESVVDELYFMNSSSDRASRILYKVVDNLQYMYKSLKIPTNEVRCMKLKRGLMTYDVSTPSDTWYNNFINRCSKIIYNRGPLGLIEKPLLERFGPPKRVPEIEEFEEEDVE